MKLTRQLEILTLLLKHERITAPALAKRLEVSRRTIVRDIEDLCQAGIPIATIQGAGGGIFIPEGYKLDKHLLTPKELQDIFAGLQGLSSVNGTENIDFLHAKLALQDGVIPRSNTILIDLASYYKESLSMKIALLKKAIEEKNCVTFEYYYEKGKGKRAIEPYFILFRWGGWYLFGYCLERSDFRLFKLNRLWEVAITSKTYIPRDIPEEKRNFDNVPPDSKKLVILFDPASEYLLIEEFGPSSYQIMSDGRLLFEWDYTNLNYMLRWVLGFGGAAEILEPPELRDALILEVKKMNAVYSPSQT